jgi:hydroxymethylpyrimidine/phosphomethylpyrimidine kinase
VTRIPTSIALTIAGSDPSGGAGLQADLKTFHQHQVYGLAVVSLLTVQSTRGVARVEVTRAELVAEQLDYLLADITPGAAKTGALGDVAVIEVVAARAAAWRWPLVVDPVMVSKHGRPLLAPAAQAALRDRLLPAAFLLTPNAPEAEALLGTQVRTVAQARQAAMALARLGPRHVLVKGGHLEGDTVVDVLWADGVLHELAGPRVASPHTHGTGCTLSAAITARLARGAEVVGAVTEARRWLEAALRAPPEVGGGLGPLGHLTPVGRLIP